MMDELEGALDIQALALFCLTPFDPANRLRILV
jgi:hypothetical protein